MKLNEKVAVVTGAGSSLGRAMALKLASEGASIIVADSEEAAGHPVVEAILEGGGEAAFAKVDVTDEAEIQSMVGDAIVNFGSLHLLAHCSTLQLDGDALSISREQWTKSLQTNLDSAWLCARYSAPFMKAAGGGALLFLAPTDALQTMPRQFAYAASKGALPALSRSLAIDFGPQNIRSNVIVTGWIQTEESERRLQASTDPEANFRRILSVHPLGRVGSPEDVAKAGTFLLSDDAAFITGTTLTVDGGRSAVIQDLHDW